ncbi:MAG: ASCH domain-containing protein [Acidimicrobiales bacterium]
MNPPKPRRDPIPFHPRFNEVILRGEKTVTRRFRPRHIDQWLRAKNPDPGMRPDQWPVFADLVVTDCRSVRLQSITKEEAQLEGLGSVFEFEQIWHELYDKSFYERWDRNPPVWRIEFRCVSSPPPRYVPLEVEA